MPNIDIIITIRDTDDPEAKSEFEYGNIDPEIMLNNPDIGKELKTFVRKHIEWHQMAPEDAHKNAQALLREIEKRGHKVQ